MGTAPRPLKDCWDMVTLVDECPGMLATFNPVPSLIALVEPSRQPAHMGRQLVIDSRAANTVERADSR